jgi:hypothetical protein
MEGETPAHLKVIMRAHAPHDKYRSRTLPRLQLALNGETRKARPLVIRPSIMIVDNGTYSVRPHLEHLLVRSILKDPGVCIDLPAVPLQKKDSSISQT